jgi:four helix bundle protein
VFLFERLAVYQKALSLAERISNHTAEFPRGCWYLADQLNRASLSISLNIAKGRRSANKCGGQWPLDYC